LWKTRCWFDENKVLDARTFASLLKPARRRDSIDRNQRIGNNPSTGFPQACTCRKLLPAFHQERFFLSHARRQGQHYYCHYI
jgi:hypothetical protein